LNNDEYTRILQNIGVIKEISDLSDYSREKDQIIYYRRKYVAKEAVAANVLQTLVTSGYVDRHVLERFCIEEPVRSSSEQGQHTNLSFPRIISPKFGTLKSLLHLLYSHSESYALQQRMIDNCFEYEMLESSSSSSIHVGPWYTATFISPLSDEKFNSGSLFRIIMNESDSDKYLVNQIIDGRVYYQNKFDAEEAAVARALDCFVMRGMLDDKKSLPSLLLDDIGSTQKGHSIDIAVDGMIYNMPKSTTMHTQTVDSTEPTTGSTLSNVDPHDSPSLSDESSLNSVGLNESTHSYRMELMSPSILLSRLYLLIRGLPVKHEEVDNCYEYTEIRIPERLSHLWYSATFTCPYTNQKYEPLDLNDFFSHLSRDGKTHYVTTFLGDKFYYAKKSHSKDGAAARALNEFVEQGKLEKCALERFCKEAPYAGSGEFLLKFPDRKRLFNSKFAHLILLGLYTRNYPDAQDYEECFKCKAHLFPTASKPNMSNEWWTSSFTCPVSGEIFDAGTLHILDVGARWSDYSFCQTADGMKYYKKRNDAKEAAAARALDCFIMRGCFDKALAQGQCKEDQDTQPSVEFVSDDQQELNPSTSEYVDLDTLSSSSNSVEDHSTDILISDTQVSLCPKSILENHFADLRITRCNFSTTTYYNSVLLRTPVHLLDPTVYDYWTSAFTDPINGEVFSSGTLLDFVNKDAVTHDEATISPPLYFTADDKVHYRHKKSAEKAAAGRAVDSYDARRMLDLGFQIPRFCRENPDTESFNKSYDQTNATAFYDIDNDILDESLDDYVVGHIPGACSADGFSSQSTMDRILEAWADASSPQSPKQVSATSTNLNESAISCSVAASNALNWLERITVIHGKQTALDTTKTLHMPPISSINAVLNALGEANEHLINRDSTLVHNGEVIDIESTAKKILDRLIATTTVEGLSSPRTLPNVETFNAYISCFRNQRASFETATKAEALLVAMLKQEDFQGFKLPCPNEDTFNTVLKIWALVPHLGRTKIDEILRLMEAHHSVKPNRKTFLLYLSSLPKLELASEMPLSENYLEIAARVIDRMKTYEELFGDEYLMNCEVYNAPLPPGDECNLQRVYESGFVPYPGNKSLDSVHMAENVDKWIHGMERLAHEGNQINVAPNSRTYESAIFAWIRTGTRYGLEKAEALAKRVIERASTDSELTPGTKLFSPIISAWVFSGDEHAPKKVREWTEIMSEFQSYQSHSKIDPRIREAEILAWKHYHRSLTRQLSIDDRDCLLIANIVNAARECSACLDKLYQAPLESSDFEVFDGNGLQAVLDVWSETCIALVSHQMKDSLESQDISCSLEQAIEQIFIVLTFVDTVSDNTLNQYDMIQNQKSQQQQLHLQSILIPCINIYISALHTFRKLSECRISSTKLYDYFSDMESIIRRVVELSLKIDPKLPCERGLSGLAYHEDPLFRPVSSKICQTPSAYSECLLDDILSLCENINPPAYITADILRVLSLLLSQTQLIDDPKSSSDAQNAETESVFLRLIPFITCFVKNEHEKALVLYRLYTSRKSSHILSKTIIDACPSIKEMIEQSRDDSDGKNTILSRKKRIRVIRKRSYS